MLTISLLTSCGGNSGGDGNSSANQSASPKNSGAHSDGRGDLISDSDVPEWWGEYKSEEAFCSVAISNFSGTSFNFEIYFLRNGQLLYDGVAAVDPDNSFIAEYGEFSFSLSGDFNVIDITLPEGSEWSHLSGSYDRIEIDETTGSYEYSRG